MTGNLAESSNNCTTRKTLADEIWAVITLTITCQPSCFNFLKRKSRAKNKSASDKHWQRPFLPFFFFLIYDGMYYHRLLGEVLSTITWYIPDSSEFFGHWWSVILALTERAEDFQLKITFTKYYKDIEGRESQGMEQMTAAYNNEPLGSRGWQTE